jgi:hypothetical protein
MRFAPGSLIIITILTLACGLKTEMPSQIPSTTAAAVEGYDRQRIWFIDGVSDMLIHRASGIFSVIQHDDSLSIFKTFAADSITPANRRIFQGLQEPALLSSGFDTSARLWAYDRADDYLRGYDGYENSDTMQADIVFHDENWLSVVALAADDSAHIFVAEKINNKIYTYTVDDGELDPTGELTWGAQVSSRIVDMDFGGEYLLLLVEGDWPLRRFVWSVASQVYEELDFNFPQQEFVNPSRIVTSATQCFVLDAGDSTVWELPIDEIDDPGAGLLVTAARTDQALIFPAGVALNDDKVYIADTEQGRVIDYEKRQ